MDVLAGEAGMLGQDLLGRHTVRDHRDHSRYRKAQPADARQATHDIWVRGDALKGHAQIITVTRALTMHMHRKCVAPDAGSETMTTAERPRSCPAVIRGGDDGGAGVFMPWLTIATADRDTAASETEAVRENDLTGTNKSGRRESNPHDQLGRCRAHSRQGR